MPTPSRQPQVSAVDETAAAPATVGGEGLASYVDETSLSSELRTAVERNRMETRPFRQYQKKVILRAEVPNTHQTRQMASHICGAVARLPFVPDDEEKIKGEDGTEITEFEQQVIKTASKAEEMLDSEMVWTVSARKIARAALELRKTDPDGTKGIAWVNDTRTDEAGVLDA